MKPQTTSDYLLYKTENLTEAERKSMDSERRAIQRFEYTYRFTDSNCETTAIQAQIVISLPSTQESMDYPMPDSLTPISNSLVMGTTLSNSILSFRQTTFCTIYHVYIFRIKFYFLFPKKQSKNINMETKNSFSGIYFLSKLNIPILIPINV